MTKPNLPLDDVLPTLDGAGQSGIPAASAPRPAGSLAARTVAAAQWRFGAVFTQTILQLTVGVVLARLLAPRDFGTVSAAMLVIALVGMFSDIGIGSALVSARSLSARHLRTAFTMQAAAAALIAATLILLAPLSDVLLPNGGLPAILRWLALLFPIAALGAISQALLRRNLDYRRLFIIDILSYGCGYGVVTIVLASTGFGVWSLVLGALAHRLLSSSIGYGFRPHSLVPRVDRSEFLELGRSGAGFTANTFANYAALNADTAITGRLLGAEALGFYARAYSLMSLPLSYVAAVTSSILLPAFVEASNDRQALRRGYTISLQLAAFVGAPTMAVMFTTADYLVPTLYGSQWTKAILPLKVLALAGFFRMTYHVGGVVAQATGNVFSEFRRQVVYAILIVLGSVAGSRWGIGGVAAGVGVAILGMYFMMASLSLRLVGASWADFAVAQLPGIFVGSIVAISCTLANLGLSKFTMDHWVGLVIQLGVAAIATMLGIGLLPRSLRPVDLFARLELMTRDMPISVQRGVMLITRPWLLSRD